MVIHLRCVLKAHARGFQSEESPRKPCKKTIGGAIESVCSPVGLYSVRLKSYCPSVVFTGICRVCEGARQVTLLRFCISVMLCCRINEADLMLTPARSTFQRSPMAQRRIRNVCTFSSRCLDSSKPSIQMFHCS